MESTPSIQFFESHRARRRFFVHLMVGTLVVLGAFFLLQQYAPFLFDAGEARAFVDSFGVLAPLVLIALQALQVVFAPVPGQVLAVVAGYLFGPWWGTLFNMIGITIGSTAAFWLARRYGRAYVESIVAADALERFDNIGDRPAMATLFVLFLIPGLPDDVLCFAGGLTKIPLRRLVAIAVVGRTPAFFLVNVIGGLVGTGALVEATLLTLAFLFVSALAFLFRVELTRRVLGE